MSRMKESLRVRETATHSGSSRPGESLRVGFLGTGYIADWHAKALGTIPGVSLVAVCDKDLPRARTFGERYGAARCYESLEQMLGDGESELDVVHVLLPPDLHARAASALIDAGLHVFLEKPMATDAQECASLVEQAAKRGVTIGVNHNFLFAPVYEDLRRDLIAGKLGKPDHVTITWNRELEQVRSGPFNLWMLREPANIMLEVGPHCLAPILDLIGFPKLAGARATAPVDLPGGRRFYRRWHVEAEADSAAITLQFSFAPGFTEQTIHVRGTLGSATVDLERNLYVLRRHTRYGMDFDRYRMVRDEAGSLAAQARRTLNRYLLSKLKLSSKGSPYGLSIARALQSFYAGLGGDVDRRLSAEMGRDLIGLCSEIGRMGVVEPIAAPAAVPPLPVAPTGTSRPADILLLGATGFIGQELARQLLSAGHRIRLLVRNPGRLPDELRGPGVEVDRRGSDTNRGSREGHRREPLRLPSCSRERQDMGRVRPAGYRSHPASRRGVPVQRDRAPDLYRDHRLVLRGEQGRNDHRGDPARPSSRLA